MRTLAIALLLAACGDNSRPSQLDATGPSAILLDTVAPPTFIMYRDGNGPWQDPGPPNAKSQYTLQVTGAYEVVTVCAAGSGAGDFEAEELYATAADGEQSLVCGLPGPSPMGVSVTGTMNQAGTVSMFNSARSAIAPWNFNLQVPPGAHELVALGGGKALVRRGLMVTGATSVPTIDLDVDGMATSSQSLTIHGVQAGTIYTFASWATGHDAVLLSETTNGGITLPPAALVQTGDSVSVQIEAIHANAMQGVDVFDYDVASPTTSYTLPALPTGVSYTTPNNTVTATWGTLPTYTILVMSVYTGTSTFQAQDVWATPSWIAETQATSLAFDASAPQFSPAWLIPLTSSYFRELSIYDTESTADYFASLGESVGSSPRRMPPSRHFPRELTGRTR